ncbi:MAG TPA: arginine--tRNA ligase [Polyangiaceae bacterium]|nr:arginine--tRNA ligase [Polyangiaceae bacterium]
MSDLQASLIDALQQAVAAAVAAALGDEHAGTDPLLRPSKDTKFGDFQANLAMSLGKKLGKPPRQLADMIAQQLQPGDLLSKVEVAGPGFINLTVSAQALNRATAVMLKSERLAVPLIQAAGTAVIDYGSPNCAKEMHIGHLRSSIIGDAISRVLEFRGERVIRQNHLGDWGTQFGMLLELLLEQGWSSSGEGSSIHDLDELYRQAKQKFDADAGFAERARMRVVKLQAGDEPSLKLWQSLINESARHMNEVFRLLGVRLTDKDIRPESFYNSRLPQVVEALRATGALVESEGAQVVFPNGFKDREGEPLPMIVQKSDGGFGYAATDLAAARFRVGELQAKRVIYVVDARQSDHFAMLFTVLNSVGWTNGAEFEHVAFGTILGADKKPFKTRAGGTVRLIEVLEEATKRAATVSGEKLEGASDAERAELSRAVGVSAVKYADLSSDRIKDYVFDWDRMLALEGNTAPYLQNAYVRIRSIFRKGEVSMEQLDPAMINIEAPEERMLAVHLSLLSATLDQVATSLEPHRLCGYLYELASLYHRFYEHCPVLKAETAVKQSRLALSALTGRVLALGLELLGISVIERM